MKYMVIENGIITAFYSSDIHEDVPCTAIAISDELWQELLVLGQARLINKNQNFNFTISDFEQNVIELTACQKAEQEVNKLMQYLLDTDYIAIKIAEGVSTKEDYAEVLGVRQEARARINELKKEIGGD